MKTATLHIVRFTQDHHLFAGWYAAPPTPDPTVAPNPGVAPIDVNAVAHHLISHGFWLVAALLFAVAGVTIMGRSRRGNMSEAATTGGITMFGALFIATAFVIGAFATGIVNTLLGI